MNARTKLRISAVGTLPTLLIALAVLIPFTVTGLTPWPVIPAVVLSLGVQLVITYVRLGRS
ncbi:hypothetical protein ABT095_17660 [Kitasatospora sp. NPDC002227]|uniref:hypothetical protein n=1 Tax=Kitasatospora sp. NPDC002227 TaxID=3154773 RepID=UPI00332FB3F6